MLSLLETFIKIISSGAVVNFVLVIIGGIVGCLLKKGIPNRVSDTLIKGMALCVMFIGIKGLFEDGINILCVIISVGVGALIGEFIDLDKLVNALGAKIEKRFSHSENTKIAEGFVSATLLFCVGAMTVVGSVNSGVSGDNTVLYSKSVIDAISAVVLASTLGVGVALSSVGVLAIEGTLTLIAVAVGPVLSNSMINYMSVIGSICTLVISPTKPSFSSISVASISLPSMPERPMALPPCISSMLGITKIKVMNLVPAIFLPIVLCLIM